MKKIKVKRMWYSKGKTHNKNHKIQPGITIEAFLNAYLLSPHHYITTVNGSLPKAGLCLKDGDVVISVPIRLNLDAVKSTQDEPA